MVQEEGPVSLQLVWFWVVLGLWAEQCVSGSHRAPGVGEQSVTSNCEISQLKMFRLIWEN